MKQNNEFITLTALSTPEGDGQYYILKQHPKGMSLLEKAFCAAMFETLAEEFTDELTKLVGSDRGYLLKEYQTLAIQDIKEAMKKILENVDKNRREKGLSKALELIKDENSELDGYSEA